MLKMPFFKKLFDIEQNLEQNLKKKENNEKYETSIKWVNSYKLLKKKLYGPF